MGHSTRPAPAQTSKYDLLVHWWWRGRWLKKEEGRWLRRFRQQRAGKEAWQEDQKENHQVKEGRCSGARVSRGIWSASKWRIL